MKTIFPIKDYKSGNHTVPLIESPLLQEVRGLRHGFSTRKGGVSKEHLSSLNLGFNLGDEREKVLENFRILGSLFEAKPEDFVLTQQTHSVNVRHVGREDRGKGIFRERDYTDVDALMTDEEGVILSAFSADCVPILFYDKGHRAIASCHSGWRGTHGRILARVIEAMQREFSSKPEEIYIAIGPSICKNCYEVSEDVGEAFLDAFPALREETKNASPIERVSEEKFHIDLWELNRWIALENSIPAENISVSGYCTMERPDLFFLTDTVREKEGYRERLSD
ncbi:peptidoglycan editing factor PgeF [Oribacterium sp. oral taxon 108]|uniref:peptidoglycan editing factor PgeF n=1 Tax=Oribacterium sp. oral taxon 108 TaxID=712414 RepID=UPI00020DD980|nr:peptidoglycan editing factor PgeF [Oribacterium sp. oral taxon 108]EGL36448.1 conserved hypothetical protein, YfiH family [Oribacterium sp. oral taxon 108 str. F0425]